MQQYDLAQTFACRPEKPPCECRLCLHAPLSSVGGGAGPTGKRCFLKLRLTPSFQVRVPASLSGSSGCSSSGLSLCAGFAVADFKAISRGETGLAYQPSFIVPTPFVNPTNYIHFPTAACFLSFFKPVFPLLPRQTYR